MNNIKIRKEVASILRKDQEGIAQDWSGKIFRVPGHRKFQDMIPRKMHADGMKKFLNALICDILNQRSGGCFEALNHLIINDYLSASTSEDTVHGQIILRNIIARLFMQYYKGNLEKLKDASAIAFSAIDNAMLHTLKIYGKREFGRLKTIINYGKKMSSVRDYDKLYRIIVEAAAKESDSDRVSLMMLDRDGYLRIKYSIGIPKKISEQVCQKVGTGIAGSVFRSARPVIINAGQKMPPRIKIALRGLGLMSAVSIPLVADSSKVLGVLNLGKYHNKPFFDQEDVELLLILAYEAGTALHNCYLFDEVHNLYTGSIVSLAAAIDARDHYTHGHSQKVARMAKAIAKTMELSPAVLERIHFAGLLHDIGKIAIPDEILLKPGKLTKKEFEVIKKHPIHGVQILKHIPRMKSIIPIIYHEHERFDGKGYVEGLKGEQIPLESRVIAVADAYEAMTSNRPYRKALSHAKAVAELKKCSGTQFDPKVVAAFLRTYK